MDLENTSILLLDIYLKFSILPFILLIFQIHFCCGKSKSKHEVTDKPSIKNDKPSIKNANLKTTAKELTQKTRSSHTKDVDKNQPEKNKSKMKVIPKDEGKLTRQDAKIPEEKQTATAAESDKKPLEDSPDFPPPPAVNELFRLGASDLDVNDDSSSDGGKNGGKIAAKQMLEKLGKTKSAKQPVFEKDGNLLDLLKKDDDKNLKNIQAAAQPGSLPLNSKVVPKKPAPAASEEGKKIVQNHIDRDQDPGVQESKQKKSQPKEIIPGESKSKVTQTVKTAMLTKELKNEI